VGLLVVLAILWGLVPFAIFGIKPRLNSLLRAVEDQTRVQQEMVRQIRSLRDQLDERMPPVREKDPE
jgi:hypothetical protein